MIKKRILKTKKRLTKSLKTLSMITPMKKPKLTMNSTIRRMKVKNTNFSSKNQYYLNQKVTRVRYFQMLLLMKKKSGIFVPSGLKRSLKR